MLLYRNPAEILEKRKKKRTTKMSQRKKNQRAEGKRRNQRANAGVEEDRSPKLWRIPKLMGGAVKILLFISYKPTLYRFQR